MTKVTDKRSLRYESDNYLGTESLDDENVMAEDLNGKDAKDAEQAIIRDGVNAINGWYSYFDFNNERFRLDLLFLFVDQWNGDDRNARRLNSKPVLMFNFLYPMVMQLLGEQRQNSPSPVVRAAKYSIPQQEVTLRDDLLRQIFYVNKADVIFQTAFMYSLAGGYGAWVVELDYENPETFQLAIRLREIPDPRTCFYDPSAELSDKSDGNFSGYFTTHSVEDYHKMFPRATSDLSFMTTGYYNYDYSRMWMDGKRIRIAHLWRKEKYEETIVELSTGESMPLDKAKELLAQQKTLLNKLKKAAKMGVPVNPEHLEEVTIERTRQSVNYKIRYYQMIMNEILEVREWPSKHLPVIFLDCQSFYQDGRQVTQSFHKFGQDEQKYLNYLRSESAEAMLNLHHGNWIGTPKNVEGKLMTLWQNPQRSKGILLANYDEKGNLPQFVSPPAISNSFETQFQMGVNNLQLLTGRYEANRGADGGEPSGVAQRTRAQLGNLASFIPFDNLKRAVEQTARVIVSLFPVVYDSTQGVIVRGKDRQERRVMLNEPHMDSYRNDMSLEGFDVTIEAGADFAIQRDMALQSLSQMMSLAPQYASALFDLYAEHVDVENMPQIVKRIREMMLGTPLPQIISEETGKPIPKQPPNPQVQAQQMDLQIRQQQVNNDKDKIALQSQEMVQDSLNDHAKNVIEVQKLNRQMQADLLKDNTEKAKAAMDNHLSWGKHLLSMAQPSQNSTRQPPH